MGCVVLGCACGVCRGGSCVGQRRKVRMRIGVLACCSCVCYRKRVCKIISWVEIRRGDRRLCGCCKWEEASVCLLDHMRCASWAEEMMWGCLCERRVEKNR